MVAVTLILPLLGPRRKLWQEHPDKRFRIVRSCFVVTYKFDHKFVSAEVIRCGSVNRNRCQYRFCDTEYNNELGDRNGSEVNSIYIICRNLESGMSYQLPLLPRLRL